MKALIHEKKAGKEGLSYCEMEELLPKEGEVRVRLETAGMNHRDLFVLNRHKESEPPLIIGSDGAGVIDAIGPSVTNITIGDEVMINPSLGWIEESDAPPKGFEIVGLPFHGTFAQSIIVPAENVTPKPSYLTWEEAGVLSLAGITAYRALFSRAKVKAGMNVLIPGIGSGVATFLLQFAKAVGATVFVTSRSVEKCEQALAIGADFALDSNSDWTKNLQGTKMDVVIDCVGAATFNKSLSQLRPGGTIVTFGSSTGDEVNINLRDLFYGQINVLGTTMGSKEEYIKMLQFIELHQIKPIIDRIYPLSEYEQAFLRLDNAEQFGKIGFHVNS